MKFIIKYLLPYAAYHTFLPSFPPPVLFLSMPFSSFCIFCELFKEKDFLVFVSVGSHESDTIGRYLNKSSISGHTYKDINK